MPEPRVCRGMKNKSEPHAYSESTLIRLKQHRLSSFVRLFLNLSHFNLKENIKDKKLTRSSHLIQYLGIVHRSLS